MTLQQYNDIKKGNKLQCTFDSSIKRDHKIDLIASGKFRTIKSTWAKSRITLKNTNGFKSYLYLSKDNKISFALGNLATSKLKITL